MLDFRSGLCALFLWLLQYGAAITAAAHPFRRVDEIVM